MKAPIILAKRVAKEAPKNPKPLMNITLSDSVDMMTTIAIKMLAKYLLSGISRFWYNRKKLKNIDAKINMLNGITDCR